MTINGAIGTFPGGLTISMGDILAYIFIVMIVVVVVLAMVAEHIRTKK